MCLAGVARPQGDVNKLQDDAQQLKPAMMVGVPRVWERVREGAEQKLNARTFIARWGQAHEGVPGQLKSSSAQLVCLICLMLIHKVWCMWPWLKPAYGSFCWLSNL